MLYAKYWEGGVPVADIKLKANLREGIGSNKSRQLRGDKLIPAIVYGKEQENLVISIFENDLDKAYLEAGTSTIIDLVIDEKSQPVLIRDVQRHPYKNQYTHVDFLMVDMSETLKVTVPVVLDNRDEIRLQPSVLSQHIDEIEIECLPVDLPQTANYDVQDMEYGDQVLVSDLDIFSNDKITFLTDTDELVATLDEPKEETEEEELDLDEEAQDVPTVDETESEEE